MVMEVPQNDFNSRPTGSAATPRPGTSLSETVANQDSGHESTASTPEMPSTPHAEQDVVAADAVTAAVLEGSQQYSVQVVFPAGEPSLKLEVNESEMIQEIYHVLLERDTYCHRTCFRLYYEGHPLDHFTEIRNVPDIKKKHSRFYVVEEPYTYRDARVHVRHLREIIRSLDVQDAIQGVEFASLSYASKVIPPEKDEEERLEWKERDCDKGGMPPPEHLLPGKKDVSLKHLVYEGDDEPKQKYVALRSLEFSPFNPPQGNRKMKGDILYLVVDTVEDRRFHISCCTHGFFVNQSNDDAFNPAISTFHRKIHHSLFNLLSEISQQFRKALPRLLKRRVSGFLLDRLPTPYQVFSWAVPPARHTPDSIRAEDAHPWRLGLEDHMPGQIRDWNEELQATRELPMTTINEVLGRERAIFKVHADFVAAAVRGAKAVIDGNVLSINPSDEPKTHMFIWHNIFISLGFDVKDHYKEVGGDAAAHAAASNDLNSIRAHWDLDVQGLYTLGMVVIDYRGVRVLAQSIIPGILERDQDQSVVYGSIDNGKTVVSKAIYEELLKNSAEELHILPHKVMTGKDDGTTTLYSSLETKGIIGNDSRHYILDLLRTFPPDVHFLEQAEVSSEAQKRGFPRSFKHKLPSFRKELVDAYFFNRCLVHIMSTSNEEKAAAKEELEKEEHQAIEPTPSTSGADKQTEDKAVDATGQKPSETEEQPPKEEAQEEGNEEVQSDGKLPLGTVRNRRTKKHMQELIISLCKGVVDIRFNPDCYMPHVKHAADEDLETQRKQLAELGEFLLTNQVEEFVRAIHSQVLQLVDGASLCELMHAHGINLRYLGEVMKAAESRQNMDFFITIIKMEIICRSARHLFMKYIPPVEVMYTGAAVAHFLNCLVGAGNGPSTPSYRNTRGSGAVLKSTPSEDKPSEDNASVAKKASKKKRKASSNNPSAPSAVNSRGPRGFGQTTEWTQLTTEKLWKDLVEDAKSHYGVTVDATNCDQFLTWSGALRTPVVRRFCQLVGVQLLIRDYRLDSVKSKTPFTEDDVNDLLPVVKQLNPRSKTASEAYMTALDEAGSNRKRAMECLDEAHAVMNSVYGPLHSEQVQCVRSLARSAYIAGAYVDAIRLQKKAVQTSERVNGLDHYLTIQEYATFGHYTVAVYETKQGVPSLYRARYLLQLAFGEDHPLMAQIDANIGVAMFLTADFDHAVNYLENALRLYRLYDESKQKIACVLHFLARSHSCRQDFRAALPLEKEACEIFSSVFGEQHIKTIQSNDFLRYVTNQAVSLQRHVSALQRGEKQPYAMGNAAYPIHPSILSDILDTLNNLYRLPATRVAPYSFVNAARLAEAKSEELAIGDGDQPTSTAALQNAEQQATLQQEDLD